MVLWFHGMSAWKQMLLLPTWRQVFEQSCITEVFGLKSVGCCGRIVGLLVGTWSNDSGTLGGTVGGSSAVHSVGYFFMHFIKHSVWAL